MCIQYEYDALTDVQRMRDEEFANSARALFIAPLIDEIRKAIPDIERMSEWDAFIELMRLNEQHAPHGERLPLYLGVCDKGTMRGYVFSGVIDEFSDYIEKDGVKVYGAEFKESMYGVSGGFWQGNLAVLVTRRKDLYDKLPLPFRIALVAQHLRQNVLVTEESSCRYAMGWDAELRPQRWIAHRLFSEQAQCYGWNVVFRDTMPDNRFAANLAQRLKSVAHSEIEASETKGLVYGFSLDGQFSFEGPMFAEQQTRAGHKHTNAMYDFVTRYLPEHGMHAGRSGDGEQISWNKALYLFEELYPQYSGIYSSGVSLSTAYRQAKQRREGR